MIGVMIKRRLLIVVAFAVLLPFSSDAQRWKRMRYEFIGGLGATNFLGELGGSNQIGTNYLKDLDFAVTRYVISAGLRYKITKMISAKAALNFGILAGDDKLTEEFSRNYRNLHFRSTIIELSAQIEPSFVAEKSGSRYRLKGIKGRRGFSITPYPFIGIGVFYFNPKAQYNGVWYALQPLRTEGQGAIATRKPYSRIQLCIPVGIGFKYAIDRKLSIGFEYGMRKTFTDYIDDVSTTYVDPELIYEATEGVQYNIAAELADPSGVEGIKTNPEKTQPGQQRGNPANKDVYMFAIISANYKFRVTKRRRRSRPKF
jgi:hypothetical protein